jgi:hypothetical protein
MLATILLMLAIGIVPIALIIVVFEIKARNQLHRF